MHEINDRSRDIGPFVPGPDDDMIICRCEEVTKGEIRKALHRSAPDRVPCRFLNTGGSPSV